MAMLRPDTVLGPEHLLPGSPRSACGESPFWHAEERALYWVDIPGAQIHRYDTASQTCTSWTLPERVGCIAPTAWGTLLAACETGIVELNLHGAGRYDSNVLTGVAHAQPNMRFNDGRCDRQGRLWVSSMVSNFTEGKAAGVLYRYTRREGLVASGIDGLIVPNGLAFSPDGRRMYLSDSHPDRRQIWVFDYDSENGIPSNRRVFADLHDYVGRPDGATVDVEGGYWICAIDAGCILRFAPDGRLDRVVQVPMRKPTMSAFWGANLDRLFVTSLHRGERDIAEDPHAGLVLAFEPGVRGIAESAFDA